MSSTTLERTTSGTEAASYLRHALASRVGEFIALRRDIHQHPELGFAEHRTAALVAQRLGDWGYTVSTGLGGTGVVGTLKRGTGTKSMGLRADMDALPIDEAAGREWKSRNAGVMHACGHDGHTATLLAAAREIAEHAQFDGTLNLIFQPAEEGGGGAVRMMEDGLFEKHPCDAVFALHNAPGVPEGVLAFRAGAAMASSDNVSIVVRGRGGHGNRDGTADGGVAQCRSAAHRGGHGRRDPRRTGQQRDSARGAPRAVGARTRRAGARHAQAAHP
jgi:hippurate hydrolase